MVNKLDLRESIESIEFQYTSKEERFQNTTLRPILKLQNDTLLALFYNFILENKNRFSTFSNENKRIFVEQSLQKNVVLKTKLLGVILGMFTKEELELYSSQSSVYNKRIMGLIVERIRSQVDQL